MIRRFTSPALRAVALMAAVVWGWTLSAAQVHQLLVAHVVCEKHEATVEIRRSADGPSADDETDHHGPTWAAPVLHPDHDHGCASGFFVPHEPPPFVAPRAVARISWATVDPLAIAEAPRGPPLAYAPKTSPPRA